jgi:hypothetical protein
MDPRFHSSRAPAAGSSAGIGEAIAATLAAEVPPS